MPKLEQSAYSPEVAPPSPKLASALLPAPKACGSFGVSLFPLRRFCVSCFCSEPLLQLYSRPAVPVFLMAGSQ